MATISMTSTAAQDEAMVDFVQRFNRSQRTLNPAWVDVTAVQYVKNLITERLDSVLRDYTHNASVTKVEAYKLATPTDQAAIDAILAKYQG